MFNIFKSKKPKHTYNTYNFPETLIISKTGVKLSLIGTNRNLVNGKLFGVYKFSDYKSISDIILEKDKLAKFLKQKIVK